MASLSDPLKTRSLDRPLCPLGAAASLPPLKHTSHKKVPKRTLTSRRAFLSPKKITVLHELALSISNPTTPFSEKKSLALASQIHKIALARGAPILVRQIPEGVIEALSPETMPTISPRFFSSLSAHQVHILSPSQVSFLTIPQLDSLFYNPNLSSLPNESKKSFAPEFLCDRVDNALSSYQLALFLPHMETIPHELLSNHAILKRHHEVKAFDFPSFQEALQEGLNTLDSDASSALDFYSTITEVLSSEETTMLRATLQSLYDRLNTINKGLKEAFSPFKGPSKSDKRRTQESLVDLAISPEEQENLFLWKAEVEETLHSVTEKLEGVEQESHGFLDITQKLASWGLRYLDDYNREFNLEAKSFIEIKVFLEKRKKGIKLLRHFFYYKINSLEDLKRHLKIRP
jgi:hypothetical protein